MKKIWVFILGIATGVILTILVSFLWVNLSKSSEFSEFSESSESSESSDNGVTWFDEPGDYIDAGQFKVFQVIESGVALAHAEDKTYRSIVSFTGPVVLFVNDEGKYYYDDEVIKVTSGKRARQVGIYEYSTSMGYKTVPIIQIME